MKKLILSLFTLCIALSSTAQTWTTSGSNIYYNAGNVGIGTISPNAKLHIEGDVQIKSGEKLQWGGTQTAIEGSTVSNKIALFTNSLERLRVDNGGNVGIGTTSPTEKLEVNGSLLLDLFGNSGHEKGIFFRKGFTSTNKYNVSILAYDHNGGGSSPDGLSINGVDGVSFSTGSDNRNERMRIAQDGNVGIGTDSPQSNLDIVGDNAGFFVRDSRDIEGSSAMLRIQAGGQVQRLKYFWNDRFAIDTGEGGTEQLTIKRNGNIGIGTTTPNNKLEVNGTIRSKKVKVEATDWPDFVFAPNFKLRTLNELEAYIKTNQHLPEVPSAKEVEESGLDLGKMDATLLQKVEELTLYLIEESKEKDELKKENQELKVMFLALKKEIEALKEKNKE